MPGEGPSGAAGAAGDCWCLNGKRNGVAPASATPNRVFCCLHNQPVVASVLHAAMIIGAGNVTPRVSQAPIPCAVQPVWQQSFLDGKLASAGTLNRIWLPQGDICQRGTQAAGSLPLCPASCGGNFPLACPAVPCAAIGLASAADALHTCTSKSSCRLRLVLLPS